MSSLRRFLRARKRVRRRFTKQGLFLLLILAGLFLEAYMHDFNLVYITLFFIVAAAMAAYATALLNLGGLQASCTGCGRLFAHRRGICRFVVENGGRSVAWGVDLVCGGERVELPPVPAGGRVTADVAATPKKRG
jgi:hypothetical protein